MSVPPFRGLGVGCRTRKAPDMRRVDARDLGLGEDVHLGLLDARGLDLVERVRSHESPAPRRLEHDAEQAEVVRDRLRREGGRLSRRRTRPRRRARSRARSRWPKKGRDAGGSSACSRPASRLEVPAWEVVALEPFRESREGDALRLPPAVRARRPGGACRARAAPRPRSSRARGRGFPRPGDPRRRGT